MKLYYKLEELGLTQKLLSIATARFDRDRVPDLKQDIIVAWLSADVNLDYSDGEIASYAAVIADTAVKRTQRDMWFAVRIPGSGFRNSEVTGKPRLGSIGINNVTNEVEEIGHLHAFDTDKWAHLDPTGEKTATILAKANKGTAKKLFVSLLNGETLPPARNRADQSYRGSLARKLNRLLHQMRTSRGDANG